MGQRDIRHTKNPDWLRSTSRNITDTNDYRAGLATELGAPAGTTLLAFLSRGSQELICKSLNGAGPSERRQLATSGFWRTTWISRPGRAYP
jgi:hypothetical protein